MKTVHFLLNSKDIQKVKEVGDVMTGEPATEARLNGSRNYNCPKLAKFLVGLAYKLQVTVMF